MNEFYKVIVDEEWNPTTYVVTTYHGYQPVILTGQKGIFININTYPLDGTSTKFGVEYVAFKDNARIADDYFNLTAVSGTSFKFKWPPSTRLVAFSYMEFDITIA